MTAWQRIAIENYTLIERYAPTVGDRRAELTVGRDYCRGCGEPTRQHFAGYATRDGHENSVRPRAFYRQCERCGTSRLVLGNVTDAEGLCRMVLKKWLDGQATRAVVGARGQPLRDGSLDPEDALAFLQQEVWHLYLHDTSANSFLGYASETLPKRLSSWCRDAGGEASDRAKGRRFPKAHAASVSVSFDGLLESAGQDKRSSSQNGGDRQSQLVSAAGGLGYASDGSFGAFVADHAEASSADLLRLLTEGSGGEAEHQRGPGGSDLERLATAD